MYDLSQKQFGFLTVLERHGSNHKKLALWLCKCLCGKLKIVPSTYLINKRTTSCGCKRTKHGHAGTRKRKASLTYSSWQNMCARLYPSYPSYELYKRRGIKICDRWRKFENFLADMGERPGKEYSLDRWPNNDGNYEPGNCRWATKREQANNRTTNLLFEYRGRKYTLANLARHTGVSKELLRSRLCRSKKKWTVAGALRVPNHWHNKSVIAE